MRKTRPLRRVCFGGESGRNGVANVCKHDICVCAIVRLSFFCPLSTFHFQKQFMTKKSVDFSIARLRH